MALPPRIPKKPKRDGRWKSPVHRNFVRSHSCSVPDCRERPIEVAHVRLGSGAGVGQKPDDWRVVSLCQKHHAEQHQRGEMTFWTAYCALSGQTVDDLIAEFCAASPKAREIAAAKRERGL